jgi:hypothetical protein
MGQSNWVHLDDCEIKRETEKAFLIEYEGEELWLPKSVLSEADNYEVGDVVTLSVQEWWANDKGLESD